MAQPSDSYTFPDSADSLTGAEIAIIGMACRFPGADTVEDLWRHLCQGDELLTLLSDDELLAAGVPEEVFRNANFVRRSPVVDRMEYFDAEFFGYTPLEARVMDPQHRLFLECSWAGLERAGYDPAAYAGQIGVFTGAKTNTYLFNLFQNRELFSSLDTFQIALGNDLACMATRVSFKLGLTGPSYAVHTACSTSLVAVHLACQSLLIDECQMALAGGAAINVPQRRGYLYQPGGIVSPDGSCRTFDADAQGSNFGNGAGVVVLKRLEDALADGDHIHAVIKGSATNNDGAAKASFTAPGVRGQSAVILEALACAGVDAETISYIEAHGTATDLGDCIEMQALTDAFRASTPRKGFCAIGSVKTNLGHLETAAGVAGLIKTSLALEHRVLPPNLHFQAPNPKIDFDGSPFFVNAELQPWERSGDHPLRAGLSSFGIGSTNAHAILEEAPRPAAQRPARSAQLVLLSARSESALAAASDNLAAAFEAEAPPQLADAAYTLQVGRRRFDVRRALVCRDHQQAVEVLRGGKTSGAAARGSATRTDDQAERPVAFLLPGLGDQRLNIARGLYDTEEVFRQALDRCCSLLEPRLGVDLREVLYPEPEEGASEAPKKPDLKRFLSRGGGPADPLEERLRRTLHAQPALFAVEYALAHLWISWGIEPKALLGYSLGEYVAACLAGVLELEDALTLVAERSRLIEELPAGAMVGVSLPVEEVTPLLGEELAVAAINGPNLCVVSGPVEAVATLEAQLEERSVASRRLATSHAFHSPMMAPVAQRLRELAAGFRLSEPQIPYLSNVTGTWIRPEEATDPDYWARHLVATVRFEEGARLLLERSDLALLEMGTGQSLCSFLRLHPSCDAERGQLVLPSLPGALDGTDDDLFTVAALGRLWTTGVDPDWQAFHKGERRLRVPLPTYPFEGKYHWVEPDGAAVPRPATPARTKHPDPGDWFYRSAWNDAPLAEDEEGAPEAGPWLIFTDALGVGEAMAERLRGAGRRVTTVAWGSAYRRLGEGSYELHGADAEGYGELLADLRVRGALPRRIAHLWSVEAQEPSTEAGRQEALQRAFYSPLFLLQALGRQGNRDPLRLVVAATGLELLAEHETLTPEKAAVKGPVQVGPQELSFIEARAVGVSAHDAERLPEDLLAELGTAVEERVVSWRGGQRRVLGFEAQAVPAPEKGALPLRTRGVYLLTGGLGGVGLVVARYLAERWQAKLVLTRRRPLPPRESWGQWLAEHGPEDETSRSLATVETLEHLGAEVLVAAADAADEEAMTALLERAVERFGPVHGVFHAAGMGSGGLLALKTVEAAQQVLAPKIDGTRVLEKVLAGQPAAPDFLFLFSSLQSALGDFGQVDYCAANAFLDAYAQAADGTVPVMAVGWDNWQEVGIAVNTELPPHMKEWQRQLLSVAITSGEGVEVLERTLAQARPHWVISTQDLEARVAESHAYTAERIMDEFGDGGAAAPASATPILAAAGAALPAAEELETRVVGVWQRILGTEAIGLEDNFFDLGGNSLVGMQLISELNRELGTQIAPVTLFEAPTVGSLLRQLRPETDPVVVTAATTDEAPPESREVAIIGMMGRFPGAEDLEQFWSNLTQGVESTSFFSDQELLEAGIAPELLQHPTYVKARPILEDVEGFDAELFGYSPREAETIDPQHRLFLEACWAALEDAAVDPHRFAGSMGVFAGCSISTYLLNLYTHPELIESVGTFQTMIGNEKDSLPTRVSYKLNLRGPSVAVQTFCSTSLVAVHMAARSLLGGECDVALAGGSSVHVPQRSGYHYQDGGFVSRDGRVKAFDSRADGFIFGNGVGVVVLKRLSEALRDGDPVRAVIKGSAVNNDGSLKVGYTATSVEGQSKVIAQALDAAGVPAESIQYVECHGTGTALGDPVEIAALTKAYRRSTERTGFCPVGSVKTNIGHLDRAAGVSGLIKAVLAVEHGVIPPSLHFDQPNPQIDFAASPFYVNTTLQPWQERDELPRRAGVNSLGLGGTNAHVVLEPAPAPAASGESREWQLVALAAHSAASLSGAGERLQSYLREPHAAALGDVSYPLLTGRRELAQRRVLVARTGEEAAGLLGGDDPRRVVSAEAQERRPVYFLFPGLGGQYVQMSRGLYRGEEVFRQVVDRCAEGLEPLLGLDLRRVLYAGPEPEEASGGMDLKALLGRGGEAAPEDEEVAWARQQLERTAIAQPALFVVEYALAQLWLSWGIRPAGMVGYSLGEYVAACVAGVLELDDALEVVARRAALIQELEAGAMLAVSLDEEQARRRLVEGLSLAAVNGPEQSVIAGSPEAIAELEEALAADDVACRRLQTSHAFHSSLMEPLQEPLAAVLDGVPLSPPQIPYLSNLTGRWVTPEEATDPSYWPRHMVEPVRFSSAVESLLENRRGFFLELGPQALSSLMLQHPASGQGERPLLAASLRHGYENRPDQAFLLETLGKAWASGVEVDWDGYFAGEERRRVRLPTYAFDRQRFWVDARVQGRRREHLAGGILTGSSATETAETGGLFLPSWRRSRPLEPLEESAWAGRRVWLLSDRSPLAADLEAMLRRLGAQLTVCYPGTAWGALDTGGFSIPLGGEESANPWSELLASDAVARGPQTVLDLWCRRLPAEVEDAGAGAALRFVAERGTAPLEALVEGLRAGLGAGQDGSEEGEAADSGLPEQVWILTEDAQRVAGGEAVEPALAPWGVTAAVLGSQYPTVACRHLDLPSGQEPSALAEDTLALVSVTASSAPPLMALRSGFAWLPTTEELLVPETPPKAPQEAANGEGTSRPAAASALVLNGLGDLGLGFCRWQASQPGARLVLLESVGFPRREEWQDWLAADTGGGLVSRKIEAAQDLEALAAQSGAEVKVVGLDAAGGAGLAGLLAELAGEVGAFEEALVIFEPEPGGGDAGAALEAKAELLVSLEEALEDHSLRRAWLISALPGAGEADPALGAYLDGVAEARRGSVPWSSLRWSPPRELEESLFAALPRFGRLRQLVAAPSQRAAEAGLVTGLATVLDGGSVGGAKGSASAAGQAGAAGVSYYSRPNLGVEYVAPRDDTETAIAEIWRDMLGVGEVGVHDNFLELGGDSLLATRLVSRMRDAFQVDLPIRLFFEASTVAELAEAVKERQSGEQAELEALAREVGELSEEEAELELLRLREELGVEG